SGPVPSSTIARAMLPRRMACQESLMVQPVGLESELDRDALVRAQLDAPVRVVNGQRSAEPRHAHAESAGQPAGEVVLRLGRSPEQLGAADEEQVPEAV